MPLWKTDAFKVSDHNSHLSTFCCFSNKGKVAQEGVCWRVILILSSILAGSLYRSSVGLLRSRWRWGRGIHCCVDNVFLLEFGENKGAEVVNIYAGRLLVDFSANISCCASPLSTIGYVGWGLKVSLSKNLWLGTKLSVGTREDRQKGQIVSK